MKAPFILLIPRYYKATGNLVQVAFNIITGNYWKVAIRLRGGFLKIAKVAGKSRSGYGHLMVIAGQAGTHSSIRYQSFHHYHRPTLHKLLIRYCSVL